MPAPRRTGRPPKCLAQLVRDGTFKPNRHAHLLVDDEERELNEFYGGLPAALDVATFRARYRAATTDRERRAVALDFRDAAQEFAQRRRTD